MSKAEPTTRTPQCATRPRATRSGFTLLELLVVVAIIATLAVLLLPAALNAARLNAQTLACLSNMKQIGAAQSMYSNDNQGQIVPLYINGLAGTLTITSNWVVQNGDAVFWEDLLRLGGYLESVTAFSCPAIQLNYVIPIAGGFATIHPLGIGINYPEIGTLWGTHNTPTPWYQNQVAVPSQCIGWGDAGSVTTSSIRKSPDNWVPNVSFDAAFNGYTGGGATYFRDPSDSSWISGDALPVPRHLRRTNFLFMDTHAATQLNSHAGYMTSTGSLILRTDPRALWARDHNGPNLGD